MAKSSLTIGDLLYRLGFENEDQFVASLDKVLNQADKKVTQESEKTGKKGGQTAGDAFTKQFKATFSGAALGSFVGTALAQAFSGAVAATTRFVADSLNEYKVYEQGLLQLKLAGETNLAALSKRIHDVARASRVFSATDVSLAVGDLVKAGYDAETAFALVEAGVLGAASEVDAATGKFGDLGTTAGQLGNNLRALGYDTSQAARVMDVLARAAQDSNLDVSDMVDIVSRVGPTAKLAGLEIEDLAAMAAVLSNNGMDASLIGTGLRSVLQSLINPSGQLKGQLDELGISLVDGEGNLRDFSDVLDGLHELTQRGGEGLQILTQATGSYGSTAAASLGSASETVKEFTANMMNAEGSAQELADTMRNSAAGSAAEFEARLADARAQLGEQLMPHLVTMYEVILPALVSGLGAVIDLWEDWYFLITGTTTAIQQAEQALASQVRSGLGDELGGALLTLMEARQAVADAQAEVDNYGIRFGMGWINANRRLEAAEAELAVAQEAYDLLVATRREEQERQQLLATWSTGPQFGPQAMPEGWTPAPAQVEELAAAYRNLQQIEAELAEARAAHAAATSAEEEAAWAATIRRLEAERDARQAALKTTQTATAARVEERDAIAEEAQRVQNDLQRLKLGYEQGNLTLEQYVAAQEAHLRRLDGLYERSTTPQQSLAVLRARKAFLDELERLETQSGRRLDAIRAVNRNREEEDRYPTTLTGANLRARIRANQAALAEAEAAARREAWERTIQPELERIRQERAALEDGERPTGGSLTPEEIQRLQRRIANRAAAEAAAAQAAADEVARAEAEARQKAWEQTTQPALEKLRQEREAFEDGERPGAIDSAAVAQNIRARQEARAAAEAAQVEFERALGAGVRLAEAQRALGAATREDVLAAVEEQIELIGLLLPRVEEGSEAYYALVAALLAAGDAMAALNAEVPEFRMPDLGSAEAIRRAFAETEQMVASLRERVAAETDQTVIALLEVRIQQYVELLRELGIAVAELDRAVADGATGDEIQKQAAAMASDLMRVAESFPRALVEGVRSGDLAGALEQALGGAADFFLDMMLKSILGPITEELTAAIAKSLTAKAATDGAAGATGALGALGPTGLILGGVAVLASMLVGASRSRQRETQRNQQNVRAAVSGAPSVTYNLTGNVTVNSNAAWTDPAFTARWRSETEALVVSLLSKVRR